MKNTTTNMIILDVSKIYNIEITKEMLEKSIHSFKNAPVIYNPNQELSDYRDADRVNDFYKDKVVGIIMDVAMVDNQVIGKILWYDNCHIKEKYDNWYISLSDDKSEFILKGVKIS
ncbi:TPA: hypothetical protein KRL47_001316 [Clostridioides difficile]|nr:hypothetical protein [Clostridioides difficile]